MNLHEAIVSDIHAVLGQNEGVDQVSPTSVALALQAEYAAAGVNPKVAYASLQHLKQMARAVLAGRYSAESDESEAHQGELFSGHLQTRYPIPRSKGADPVYKLREALTHEEAKWNVEQLRKSAKARMAHADALEAWDQHRESALAA